MSITLPGTWKYGHPTITGVFRHTYPDFKGRIEFIIDTGSEYTFILPLDQRRLGIRETQLTGQIKKVHTLVGQIPFRSLSGCTLQFCDANRNPYHVPGLTILFGADIPSPVLKQCWKWFSKASGPFVGDELAFSVLGRDVLGRFAMGFCQNTKTLFLSEDTHGYQKVLKTISKGL